MKKLFLCLLASLPLALQAQIITTVAGTGTAGYTGTSGAATAAQIDNPSGLAYDSHGNFYISDCSNHVIRKVTPAGIITTVVGTNVAGYNGDGIPATAAQINRPIKIVIDAADNMYIAELYGNRIRKVTAAGIISTVAGGGTGGDGGPATAASLNAPACIAFDQTGNMYIGEYSANKIRKINAAGIISTYAGNGGGGFLGDGGPATDAHLYGLFDIAIDAAQNLYIADAANNRVRIVNASGIINTFAGTGAATYGGDGGLATAAQLNNPAGLDIDAAGNVYIADQANQRMRKVTPAGIISTFAGSGVMGMSGDGGPATAAQIHNSNEVLIMPSGNILICDDLNNKVRQIAAVCDTSTNTPPVTDTVGINDTAMFHIATTATAPTYQWQKLTGTSYVNLPNSMPYIGVTTNTLKIANATLVMDNTSYRCLITKAGGCIDSTTPATLTVFACANAIHMAPANLTVVTGTDAVFTVTSWASLPSYQWQKLTGTGFIDVPNALPYVGATTNSLTITGADMSIDSTYYRCVISKGFDCTDMTNPVLLRVTKNLNVATGNVSGNDIVAVYPNPAHNYVDVSIANNTAATLQLYNEIGQLVATQNAVAKTRLDLGNLPAGFYVLKVVVGNEVVYKKLNKY